MTSHVIQPSRLYLFFHQFLIQIPIFTFTFGFRWNTQVIYCYKDWKLHCTWTTNQQICFANKVFSDWKTFQNESVSSVPTGETFLLRWHENNHGGQAAEEEQTRFSEGSWRAGTRRCWLTCFLFQVKLLFNIKQQFSIYNLYSGSLFF